eukprot:6204912-Pleurochrysis_carterae.AAC.3
MPNEEVAAIQAIARIINIAVLMFGTSRSRVPISAKVGIRALPASDLINDAGCWLLAAGCVATTARMSQQSSRSSRRQGVAILQAATIVLSAKHLIDNTLVTAAGR